MSRFNGVLSATDNPVRVLASSANGAFHELRDTWASPWLGETIIGGVVKQVAVFASGHVRELDDPDKRLPAVTIPRSALNTTPQARTCSSVVGGLGLPSSHCGNKTTGGYADSAAQNLLLGPFSISGAVAYRIRFSTFDLESTDKLTLQDSQGAAAATMSTTGPSGLVSPWVYDTSFALASPPTGARPPTWASPSRTSSTW